MAGSHIGDREIRAKVEGVTVASAFRDQVAGHGSASALRWKVGDGWDQWTWDEYADRACRIAAALTVLGVRRGDRVALMVGNRPEFFPADTGTLLAGATPVSIYGSSSADQIAYLVGHCEARVAIVDSGAPLERFLVARGRLPRLDAVVVVDPLNAGGALDPARGVLPWDELVSAAPVDLDAAAGRVRPDDLATVIYTSGTTGPPKGVMIDHLNAVWTVESLRLALEIPTQGRRVISYLPMAHIAERMVSHYQGMVLGYQVTTCPDTKVIAQYLAEVRPELFFGVPRVWEKMYATVMAIAGADPNRKAQLDAALAVGAEAAAIRATGSEPTGELAARWEVAESEMLGMVRGLLGLDACVTAISSAAPIPVEILDFFRALGVPFSEMYGMSESSGPITWTPFHVKPGTVGPAIPGCEVALAEDGEVICRGGNVFRGYLGDEARTAEVLDEDGWLHSGDIGVLDEDGYLRIVDRKKELIITAGGKNISPANMEAALKAQELIGQACVVGDGRPFVGALVVLDPEMAASWAIRHGLSADDLDVLAKTPEVQAEIDAEIAVANERFNQVERIKRFVVLGTEWQPDSEELTPTMKLKRRGIHAKYRDEIESIYT